MRGQIKWNLAHFNEYASTAFWTVSALCLSCAIYFFHNQTDKNNDSDDEDLLEINFDELIANKIIPRKQK